MRSRFQRLFVPYFLWNILSFAAVVVTMLISSLLHGQSLDELLLYVGNLGFHIFWDCNVWDAGTNWLGIQQHLSGPFDTPLWFVRDLLIVVLFTPFIYIGIKKFKIHFLIVLFFAYLSGIIPQVSGVNVDAFMFFSIGAYFSLFDKNIIDFVRKYKRCLVSLSCVFLLLAMISWGEDSVIYHTIRQIFVIMGIFTAILITSQIVTRYAIQPNRKLVDSCFFIYASHAAPLPFIGSILRMIKKFLSNTIPGTSVVESYICYFATPFLTAILCCVIYNVLTNICPHLSMLLSGNRKNQLIRKGYDN